MFFQLIVTLIGVSLRLAPTAANEVDVKCNSTCNGTQFSDFSTRFKGDNYVLVLPENKCYNQKTEVSDDGTTFTLSENGEVKKVISFKKKENGECMVDDNGAFNVFLSINECGPDELALAFICSTPESKRSAYLVTRNNATPSKACVDGAIKKLKELNDPDFAPPDAVVYQCTRTNP